MSVPANPLASYRSYTYHHIMVACDSSESANAIANSVETTTFLRPRTGDDKYAPISTPNNKGKYVIIANGMTDAEFLIDDVEWISTTAANDSQTDRFVTVAHEGKMMVTEPSGMRFLDVVTTAAASLGRDLSSTIWLLKTIFVGHGDDHNPSLSDPITNIPPIQFIIFDITANFDAFGGKYMIDFAILSNGAAKTPQYACAADGVRIVLTNTTVGAAISQLQDAITSQYTKMYNAAKAELEKLDVGATPVKVVYKIDAGEYAGDPRYKIDDIQPPEQPGYTGVSLDFGRGVTVENALRQIMNKCKAVAEDMRLPTEPTTWKILTDVHIGDDDITVTYKLVKFPVVSSNLVEDVLKGTAKADDIKANLITFDYIYSGKNVDILDFSMKMDMGLAFFQTLSLQKHPIDQNAKSGLDEEPGSSHMFSHVEPSRMKDRKVPIYFGTSAVEAQQLHSRVPAGTVNYQRSLAAHAGLEQIDGAITIIGNPVLLAATIDSGPALKHAKAVTPSTHTLMKSWGHHPALAKINVYMPRQSGGANTDFSEQTWFDGYYYIYGITNSFRSGEFTQTLDIVSLPSKSIPTSKGTE